MSRIGYALLFLLAFTVAPAVGQVSVTVANLSGAVGQEVTVPVQISNVGAGAAIQAFEFVVSSSSADVEFRSGNFTGTLVENGWTRSCNVSINKCLGFYGGNNALTTDGSLVNLTFRMNASVSNETITLTSFRFNGGNPAVSPTEPSFTITTSTAPVANNDSYSVNEGGTLTVNAASGVLANDTDADPLSANQASTTTNGTLSFSTDGSFTYTHDGSENLTDSFTYTATDGTETSGLATVSITINQVNDAPTADAKTATTNENMAVNITLTGSDPEGDALTFMMASGPSNGSLSISGSTATYTPANTFSGTDSFTYTANDGSATSAPATVTITVVPDNQAPVAQNTAAATLEDTELAIPLTATDGDGDALTYSIVSQPSNGSVSLSGSTATYTPNANYNGADSFTYVANDGTVNSNTATVNVTVAAVNDAPTATPASASTIEEAAIVITLAGSDPDGDNLTFAIATQPSNGTVVLSGTSATYSPNTDFFGSDSFTFTANDGSLTSDPATVSITVTGTNDTPVAADVTAEGDEDSDISVTLSATDGDGDALTYAITDQPSNGTVTVNGATATYTPAANFNGTDSFMYTAADSESTSAKATATVTVRPVNDPPVATSGTAETTSDAAVQITLAGSDPDGDTLTYAISADPIFGTASISGNVVTYQANNGFVGTDAFGFTVSDGTATSQQAAVTITVLPPQTFTIQFVHGGGNGLPESIDVYYGTDKVATGLMSGGATAFLELPLGGNIVLLAPSPSNGPGDAFVTYPATWAQGSTSTAVFAGLGGNGANTRMIDYPSSQQGNSNSLVDLVIVHASAVSPALDIVTISQDSNHTPLQTLGQGLTFENVSTPFSLTPEPHVLRIQTAGSGKGQNTLAEFLVDLSSAGGEFVTLVLSQQAGSSDPAPALRGAGSTGAITTPPTVTSIDTDDSLPGEFVLRGNYPNPFNPSTTIQFDLPESSEVQIDVLDLLGRTMISVPVQSFDAGSNRSVNIDASDLSSGIYMYRILARGVTQTWVSSGTMTLIK